MSTDVDRLADHLIKALSVKDVRADRFTTGPGTAGVNIWGETGRYPITSVTISDSGRFHDYAWGSKYEHTLPIDTTSEDVAAAIVATLPRPEEAS
ncbi:hypothetical protein [Knoellia sp. LjRoot47]|uniref:hypothetical protein n=1 Tax=Knoellia sp. LjRoot47 TaxID=3342330 RepID=UPI003ECC7073